ncbi:N-acetyl-1-D-myo-inositol-2-amino-2-deoxy-alpha-D-glucopyranoside deacetylase [Rhodococcus sp. BP-252]|uniref:N-acetyl-1-D-myo-inositol-2-amino-2-deoxy-alpha- D-glucopyranoside deacetylase n=1 Tax=unclassified Rhodococcus (in: high G+C Gram-positive bacteria) TaxID=192944 RepID=UPI001C9B2361|nr:MULTISPECIES: N-acetyl-1-D-myo-inositol-2-amino-2-deoxy-alpha-D-glucopyranoside deacetylase [unclassified Rhodococcus (in: high G+C Gram-positive bacteria)]MBY6411681.1 N-acetyl-1-D-myo-inositol-2-amino-2-deoxy-alpha-D-glucopyranoside deacetylase [Rhodococcus sp. BP-320]MBY6417334.1 N-acetyl-1-D-myo-inositol-2-amino-2-deoxy-alpha-D-glucopyranoside deacetylase [Rhodococcus sp. BP-321]MBY6421881.1 N-acetyl-1-D-myo-inositol-2-amino-2-deoxy-alpha-D-glucopyranoside deacetylase [Rhodococcus sp. BP-
MDEDRNQVRLLLVHAHPDDETITTGGTIAHYAQAGVEVTVLTCSLGEEGEVIGDRWAHLIADEADQLGGYRIHELHRALDVLGAGTPHFLGGAGRWRDSGMAGTAAAANPRAFVNADRDEALTAMLTVVRAVKPHVVVGYDPEGGYGHPDHQQAHSLVTEAFDIAGSDLYPDAGAPWTPSKFYWTVTGADQLRDGIAAIEDVPDGWRMPEPGELPSVPEDIVTTSLGVRGVFHLKREALNAHATQVTVAPSGVEYALSNNIVQPILADEQYVLVRGKLGDVDASGREGDLFSGV